MAQNCFPSFRTDSLQIGNLCRALTESSDGDLVFRDVFVPQGIKLKNLAGVLDILTQVQINTQDIENIHYNKILDYVNNEQNLIGPLGRKGRMELV